MVGDTAQTIFAGSSFRFESLTSAWWVEEEERARVQSRVPEHPKVFHLALNYRSHQVGSVERILYSPPLTQFASQGITRCAHAVVHAILELFPNSIDRLAPETGIADGPSPLWIEGSAEAGFDVFSRDEATEHIEFGAKTCACIGFGHLVR